MRTTLSQHWTTEVRSRSWNLEAMRDMYKAMSYANKVHGQRSASDGWYATALSQLH